MKNLTKARVAFFMLVLTISVLMITPAIGSETGEIRIGYTAPFTGTAAEYGNNGFRVFSWLLWRSTKRGFQSMVSFTRSG